jgi:tRNA-splicing ligase RtcB (3'-phosphate/5'-hydroxy nucleic acid ligase)
MKKVIDSEKLPIKLWLDDIEEGALIQAKNLANLPFVYKWISLMPDCLTIDTEILSNNGFKKIVDLNKNDKVANYNPITKKVFFSSPNAIICRHLRPLEKVYEFASTFFDKGITCTEKHRMPLKNEMGTIADKISHKTVLSDFIWGGNGIERNKPLDITYEFLCLIAWAVADGNIKKTNKRKDGTYSSHIVRFGMTKERKIKRIKHLLDALEYSYNFRAEKNGTTAIEISAKSSKELLSYIGFDKRYPVNFIEHLSHEQALVFLEEAIKADGNWENFENAGHVVYNSKKEEDINFLSSLIAVHIGIANNNTRWTEGYKKIKMNYLSSISNNNIELSNNGISKSIVIKNEINYTDKVVCVTCESGFFIARQNGFTFVTGNCHQGYGMPIGGVMATKGVVVPNAVGVDIGCGMCAVPTSLQSCDTETLKTILGKIRVSVPVGFNHHNDPVEWYGFNSAPDVPIVQQELKNSRYQLGTLGGGNHFIEIQKGSDGFIWIMIHSGSRNFGLKIAQTYHEKAMWWCEKWYSNIPDKDLSFFPVEVIEAKEYLSAMNYALDFAKENRFRMIEQIKNAFSSSLPEVSFGEIINIHHNYAAWEHHFGEDVLVHRKGATLAREGIIGLIPGSQGTKSYVVKGMGNPDSFMSCSHGAGRKMGRKQAQRELNLESEKKLLDDQGIIHGIRNTSDLDEASGAYKSIEDVMKNQSDLVDIVVELSPLAVIKA